MVYTTLALKIQAIPFYISNAFRNLAIVKEDKDFTKEDPVLGEGIVQPVL